MTIRELYKWAVENEVEDLELGIQYMDGGGDYYGNTVMDDYGVEASIKDFDEDTKDDRYVLLYA